MIRVDISGIEGFVSQNIRDEYSCRAIEALKILHSRNGKGRDLLGWLELPVNIPRQQLSDIYSIVEKWKYMEVVVVIGIGGSYLGAKSVIDALSSSFPIAKRRPEILYAGNNMSEDYLSELMYYISDKSAACIVISKSGTTTEPAVAFRVIREFLESRYGKDKAKERIVAVTDSSKGALKQMADIEGYEQFVIPDNIGGRYSVFTPVGLLPIAAAGFDIEKLIQGAANMMELTEECSVDNPVVLYAAARNMLYSQGKKIEILVNYNPKLQYIGEWWKQLFGESEGKEGKGIFPASVNNTTDLHSIGQYIQQGERIIFETVISIDRVSGHCIIPSDRDNLDGLNFLAGKSIDECNKMAELGTKLAHIEGDIPNIRVVLPAIDEYNIGALIYLFEKACGVSAYILGVNPFNQPGVEDYKSNMFALLGKPGYEDRALEMGI